MYTSIRAELQKARRRHDLIVCLLVPVMALLWCQSAAPTGADELASAYSALFYSLPIINTILMLAALHAALPRRRPGCLSLGLHLCRGLHDFFL